MDEKKKNKGYEDLDIYQLGFDLAIKVHKISLQLPNYELYETGSQIRRSSKSVPANIVEGYGRSKYKSYYVKFLTYALESCQETISHLKIINKLYNNIEEVKELMSAYQILGGKIYRFSQRIESSFKKTK